MTTMMMMMTTLTPEIDDDVVRFRCTSRALLLLTFSQDKTMGLNLVLFCFGKMVWTVKARIVLENGLAFGTIFTCI